MTKAPNWKLPFTPKGLIPIQDADVELTDLYGCERHVIVITESGDRYDMAGERFWITPNAADTLTTGFVSYVPQEGQSTPWTTSRQGYVFVSDLEYVEKLRKERDMADEKTTKRGRPKEINEDAFIAAIVEVGESDKTSADWLKRATNEDMVKRGCAKMQANGTVPPSKSSADPIVSAARKDGRLPPKDKSKKR